MKNLIMCLRILFACMSGGTLAAHVNGDVGFIVPIIFIFLTIITLLTEWRMWKI